MTEIPQSLKTLYDSAKARFDTAQKFHKENEAKTASSKIEFDLADRALHDIGRQIHKIDPKAEGAVAPVTRKKKDEKIPEHGPDAFEQMAELTKPPTPEEVATFNQNTGK